jgi:hypothetical protein
MKLDTKSVCGGTWSTSTGVFTRDIWPDASVGNCCSRRREEYDARSGTGVIAMGAGIGGWADVGGGTEKERRVRAARASGSTRGGAAIVRPLV